MNMSCRLSSVTLSTISVKQKCRKRWESIIAILSLSLYNLSVACSESLRTWSREGQIGVFWVMTLWRHFLFRVVRYIRIKSSKVLRESCEDASQHPFAIHKYSPSSKTTRHADPLCSSLVMTTWLSILAHDAYYIQNWLRAKFKLELNLRVYSVYYYTPSVQNYYFRSKISGEYHELATKRPNSTIHAKQQLLSFTFSSDPPTKIPLAFRPITPFARGWTSGSGQGKCTPQLNSIGYRLL